MFENYEIDWSISPSFIVCREHNSSLFHCHSNELRLLYFNLISGVSECVSGCEYDFLILALLHEFTKKKNCRIHFESINYPRVWRVAPKTSSSLVFVHLPLRLGHSSLFMFEHIRKHLLGVASLPFESNLRHKSRSHHKQNDMVKRHIKSI